LVFKVENRSAIGNRISPQALGPSLGYAGLFTTTFSDAGWILTNLYWRQSLRNGRVSFVIGQVDVTDYVDVNDLASPWTAFGNLASKYPPFPRLTKAWGRRCSGG
jgi:porin